MATGSPKRHIAKIVNCCIGNFGTRLCLFVAILEEVDGIGSGVHERGGIRNRGEPGMTDQVNEQSGLSFREYTSKVLETPQIRRTSDMALTGLDRSICHITTRSERIVRRRLACSTKLSLLFSTMRRIFHLTSFKASSMSPSCTTSGRTSLSESEVLILLSPG